MRRKREKPPRPNTKQDEARREALEAIVTCSCSHGLKEHSSKGCTVDACDCETGAGMLVLGKIMSIDDL